MRYWGGKFRQRKHIIAAVARLRPDFQTYCEPFCGAMWSACAVMEAIPGRRYFLNDANPYLMRFWRAAIFEGWNPPETLTEERYQWYNKNRPMSDPATGYIGFAYSFGAKFFGGLARGNGVMKEPGTFSTIQKINTLRRASSGGKGVTLSCLDYLKMRIPRGSMVYLDPPYAGRTPQQKVVKFDRGTYKEWAESLVSHLGCTVIATEFGNLYGWKVLHDWGNTVVRHHGDEKRGTGYDDGTRELLMQVTV